MMEKFSQAFLSDREGLSIVDFLADELSLSKGKIKDAMQKGAVWLHRKKQDPIRVRRAKENVKLNDDIHIYYDEAFLALKHPPLTCVLDHPHYSVWIKQLGFLDEESLYGDHLSLARAIETDIPNDKDCFFVDPVESHITGLLLIAHTAKAGESFTLQSETNTLTKDFLLTIGGKFSETQEFLELPHKKIAVELKKYHPHNNTSEIILKSAQGFETQIIESLIALGFQPPELDEITCCKMSFIDPVSAKPIVVSL